MYACSYCQKKFEKSERVDYSPLRGLVHYDCHFKDIKSKASSLRMVSGTPSLWLDELMRLIGTENIVIPASDSAYYYQDHSTDFIDLSHGYKPDVVVRPKTEEQISRVVAFAARKKIPITPRGAGTGFVGGAVAMKGGILIDLTSMNRIIEIDEANYTVTAEAGAVIKHIEQALQERGLTLGFDPGSTPVVTIGGSVSTDQIGANGWYSNLGSMGRRVLRLKVVIPDGTVVTTGRKVDRATSTMNLTQLFVGAEGLLGLITEVTIKIFPMPETTDLRVIRFDSFRSATRATSELNRSAINPAIQHTAEEIRYEELTAGPELGSSGIIVLGFAGAREVVDAQCARAIAICELCGGKDDGKGVSEEYWSKRHEAFPVNLPNNKVYGLESVSLPLDKMLYVYEEFCKIIEKHGLRRYYAGFGTHPTTFVFGYIFDNTEEGLRKKTAATGEMLKVSTEAGGTISAAHGIGIIKRKYYQLEYDQNLLLLMRKVKRALDPDGIMNPGKAMFD